MRFYLAVSIHKKYTFIRAWRDIEIDASNLKVNSDYEIEGRKFRVLRISADKIKLHAPELEKPNTVCTSGIGPQSIDTPRTIYDYFQELKKEGWQVDDASFVARHKLKQKVSKKLFEACVTAAQKTENGQTVQEAESKEEEKTEENKKEYENKDENEKEKEE